MYSEVKPGVPVVVPKSFSWGEIGFATSFEAADRQRQTLLKEGYLPNNRRFKGKLPKKCKGFIKVRRTVSAGSERFVIKVLPIEQYNTRIGAAHDSEP